MIKRHCLPPHQKDRCISKRVNDINPRMIYSNSIGIRYWCGGKLTRCLAVMVCFFMLSQPINIYAESVSVSMSIPIEVPIVIEPDHTLPFQYIGEQDGYLWNPSVPADGVADDRVDPLPGTTWLPLGVWGGNSDIDNLILLKGIRNDAVGNSNSLALTTSFYWRDIEPAAENEFLWNDTDVLLRRLNEQGIKVFVVIHIDPQPIWIEDELLSQNSDGAVVDRISYTHPDALSQVREFVETLVTRYSVGGDKQDRGKAVAGWILDLTGEGYVDGSNYIGYEPASIGYDPDIGFSSIYSFREWLEDEYLNDISSLNTVWANDNEVTPGYLPNYRDLTGDGIADGYIDFTEVDMPEAFNDIDEFTANNKASWYDLNRWREYVISSWTREIIDLINDTSYDPGCLQNEGLNRHLISIVSSGEEQGDSDWQYSGIDIAKIADLCSPSNNGGDLILDFWSIISSPSTESDNESISSQWELIRTRAKTVLPVMILQLGVSGDVGPELEQRILTTNIWEFLYAGALGVNVYDGGDSLDVDSITNTAINQVAADMVSLNMDITDEAGEVVQSLGFTEFLVSSDLPTSKVGFLEIETLSGVNRTEAEIYSLYGALKRLGFQPGFIGYADEEELIYELNNINNIYNNIILPRSLNMSDDLFSAIFIDQSIESIFANSDLPGLLDEYGVPRHSPQAEDAVPDLWRVALDDYFGIDANNTLDVYESPLESVFRDSKGLINPALGFNSSISMWKYYDNLSVTYGDTIASFSGDDASPALVTNNNKTAISLFSFGDNRGDNWGYKQRSEWLGYIYKNNNIGLGLSPEINITGSPYIWMDYRPGPEGSVLIYLYNYLNGEETIQLESDMLAGKKVEVLLPVSGVVEDENKEDNVISLSIGPQKEAFLLATNVPPPEPDPDPILPEVEPEPDSDPSPEPVVSDGSDTSGEDNQTNASNDSSSQNTTTSSTSTTPSDDAQQTTTSTSDTIVVTKTETESEDTSTTGRRYGPASVIILESSTKKKKKQVFDTISSQPASETVIKEPNVRTTVGDGFRIVKTSGSERNSGRQVLEPIESSPLYKRDTGSSSSSSWRTSKVNISEPEKRVSYATKSMPQVKLGTALKDGIKPARSLPPVVQPKKRINLDPVIKPRKTYSLPEKISKPEVTKKGSWLQNITNSIKQMINFFKGTKSKSLTLSSLVRKVSKPLLEIRSAKSRSV